MAGSSVLTFRTLDDVDAAGKSVVVRVDLNVPIRGGVVTDLTRIERIIPTLRELVLKGAKVVLLSHLGRPNGKVVPELSLEQLVGPLHTVIGRFVSFVATDWRDHHAPDAVAAAAPGDVLLMENTSFHPGEERNDVELAALFAALGDLYVNDAFSAAHRAHASTEGVAHMLPAVAGRAMQAELEVLSRLLEAPDRPVMALVGGAKVSTKLDLLVNLMPRVQSIGIGGAMANTFLAAQGMPVGKSLAEHGMLDDARRAIRRANETGCDILLPVDVVVAGKLEAGIATRTVPVDQVGADEMIFDIGPDTVARLEKTLNTARTLVWMTKGPSPRRKAKPDRAP